MTGLVTPHDLDAEQGVLGGCLILPAKLLDVMPVLTPADFYRTAHQRIYAAMVALTERGVEVDLVTLMDELRRSGTLDQVGGPEYLAELVGVVPHAAHTVAHAKLVRGVRQRRDLLRVAREIAERIEGEETTETLVEWAESQIFAIGRDALARTYQPIHEDVVEVLDQVSRLSRDPRHITGIATGWVGLDVLTSGWQRGDLVIVAGRPGTGKTSFGLQTALAAARAGTGVAFASLEMSRQQIVARLLSIDSCVEGHRLRTGHVLQNQWARLTLSAGAIGPLPIWVNDTAQGIMPMRSQLRQLVAQHPEIRLVVVDYLQLIPVQLQRGQNRQQEVSRISQALKALARELQVTVIALAQLNRECYARPDHRPILADLRESGSLEQDADLVIGLYRDEMFNAETEDQGIAEFLIRKQRNGPTGELKLRWVEHCTRFDAIEPLT